MRDLQEYGAAFEPGLAYADSSKELLLEALRDWAAYIRKLDGTWCLTVKEKEVAR